MAFRFLRSAAGASWHRDERQSRSAGVHAAEGESHGRRHVLLALGAVLLAVASGGTGTALAVHNDGAIVTNSHVIEDAAGGAGTIKVTLGLDGSVTSGIVSALNRAISVGSSSDQPFGQQTASKLTGMIQTDTAMNPGSSGGALVNDSGQVVGVTTAIASTGGGYIGQQSGSIGFAIPASTAITIADQILAR